MFRVSLLFLSILTHPSLWSAPVTLQVEPGGAFEVLYILDSGHSAAGIVQIGGTLEADLDFVGDTLSGFQFTGGGLTHSDTNFDVALFTFPAVAWVRIEARNIVGRLVSSPNATSIDPVTGLLPNSGHSSNYNEGTIRTRYLVGSTTLQEDLRNLASKPDVTPLVGSTTVTATIVDSGPHWVRRQINLLHTRDETRTQATSGLPEGAGGTLFIREAGSFSATGDLLSPSAPFIAWAESSKNLTPESPNDYDPSSGNPLAVLYAFGTGQDPWSVPIEFLHEASIARVKLPAGGLLAPVLCEFSPDLANESWQPLDSTNSPGGILHLGAAGDTDLPLPTGSRGFLRFSVPIPEWVLESSTK